MTATVISYIGFSLCNLHGKDCLEGLENLEKSEFYFAKLVSTLLYNKQSRHFCLHKFLGRWKIVDCRGHMPSLSQCFRHNVNVLKSSLLYFSFDLPVFTAGRTCQEFVIKYKTLCT